MLFKTKKAAQAHARKNVGANYADLVKFFEEDGEWGYEPKVAETVAETVASGASETAAELEQPAAEVESEQVVESDNTPSTFGLMVSLMMPDPGIPQPAVANKTSAEPAGLKIEKNRAEQNGIKRPSNGSTCAIIWSVADKITLANGAPAQFSQVANELVGYNEHTLKTQYARWRQFNGVTGRLAQTQPKQSRLPDDWTDALDALRACIPAENADALDALDAVKNPLELVTFLATKFGR